MRLIGAMLTVAGVILAILLIANQAGIFSGAFQPSGVWQNVTIDGQTCTTEQACRNLIIDETNTTQEQLDQVQFDCETYDTVCRYRNPNPVQSGEVPVTG